MCELETLKLFPLINILFKMHRVDKNLYFVQDNLHHLKLLSLSAGRKRKKRGPFVCLGFLGGRLQRLPKKLWFSAATVLLLDMVMDGAGE